MPRKWKLQRNPEIRRKKQKRTTLTRYPSLSQTDNKQEALDADLVRTETHEFRESFLLV